MEKNPEFNLISKAIIRGRIHLYEFEDAFELITICESQGFPILGIDSFIVTDTTTQPFLEHSIDFSSESSSLTNSHEKAKTFLNSKRCLGFIFEIVYSSHWYLYEE